MASSAQIRQKIADLASKRADIEKKIGEAQKRKSTKESKVADRMTSAERTSSRVSQQSYLRQAESARKDALAEGKKIADYSTKLAGIARDEGNRSKELTTALKGEATTESRAADKARRERERDEKRLADSARRKIVNGSESGWQTSAVASKTRPTPSVPGRRTTPPLPRLSGRPNSGSPSVSKRYGRPAKSSCGSCTQRLAPTVTCESTRRFGGSRPQSKPPLTGTESLSSTCLLQRPGTCWTDSPRSGRTLCTSQVMRMRVSSSSMTAVTPTALGTPLRLARSSAIEAPDEPPVLVVLNACKSAAQLESLLGRIALAVGMSDSVGDLDALTFATRFYRTLAEGHSVFAAMATARADMEMNGLPDHDLPTLAVRDDVDATAVRLVVAEQ